MRVIITKLFFVLIVIALPWAGVAGSNAKDRKGNEKDPVLVLRFQQNKTVLDEPSRIKLENALDGFYPLPSEKILVVGFADSTGKSDDNTHLSLSRAEAVRSEILKRMGYPPQSVLAVGKGENNPVSDNRNAKGRAKNRRAEVYLARPIDDHLEKRTELRQPDLPAIETFIEEARNRVRQRDLQHAVQALNEAKAEGGERVSSWHAVSGIAAFYAGRPFDVVKAHFNRALALDGHNQEARDFLGRIEARQLVEEGNITITMGRSADSPVLVSCREQEHEYLRLFHIQAAKRTRIEEKHLAVWTGSDENGNNVTYYFDYAGAMDDVFAPLEMDLPLSTQNANISQKENRDFSRSQNQQVHNNDDPGDANTKQTATAAGRIWESHVYR